MKVEPTSPAPSTPNKTPKKRKSPASKELVSDSDEVSDAGTTPKKAKGTPNKRKVSWYT